MKNPEQTVGKMADKQKVAFISGVDEAGYPNTKAMLAPRKRVGIQTFYFSTNTSSRHVGQFRQNPKACIYFCDTRFFRGAMLLGTMEVLEDQISKDMLWEKGDTQYYSLGVTDPDYCVLRFTATGGRFYSNFKSEDFPIPSAEAQE